MQTCPLTHAEDGKEKRNGSDLGNDGDRDRGVSAFKKLSATEVAKAHLERLDTVNPKINAVVQDCREDALQAARRVDETIARGEDPGQLVRCPRHDQGQC